VAKRHCSGLPKSASNTCLTIAATGWVVVTVDVVELVEVDVIVVLLDVDVELSVESVVDDVLDVLDVLDVEVELVVKVCVETEVVVVELVVV